MQSLSILMRIVLGLVLLAASIGKLFNMESLELALEQYRLPHARVLKYVILMIELAAGLSLVMNKAVIISSSVSLLLFSTILALYALMYNKTLNRGCGCFGSNKAVVINRYEIGKIISLILLSAAVFFLNCTGIS